LVDVEGDIILPFSMRQSGEEIYFFRIFLIETINNKL